MSDEEIRANIAAICAEFERRKTSTPRRTGYSYDEPKAADLAREICDDLLMAVGANGLGGCMLCQRG